MKKILITLGICLLIATMPAMTSLSLPKFKNINKPISILEKVSLNEEDIPIWADGTINGTWGLREFFLSNMIEIPIGNISGYYGKLFGQINIFSGKIYPNWNTSLITNITGIYFGPVLFGGIGDINLTVDDIYNINVNETNYVGIGNKNDTDFNWRIMGISGPTFFIKGDFTQFE